MSEVDIDAILTEVQDEVSRRRRAGDYPEGLEQQLEAEFSGLLRATDRHEISIEELTTRVAGVDAAVRVVGSPPERTSKVPGGSQVHAAAALLVSRQTTHLAQQIREVGTAVHAALQETARIAGAQQSADERQLVDILANVYDRLAVVDSLVDTVRDLDERLATLEASSDKS